VSPDVIYGTTPYGVNWKYISICAHYIAILVGWLAESSVLQPYLSLNSFSLCVPCLKGSGIGAKSPMRAAKVAPDLQPSPGGRGNNSNQADHDPGPPYSIAEAPQRSDSRRTSILEALFPNLTPSLNSSTTSTTIDTSTPRPLIDAVLEWSETNPDFTKTWNADIPSTPGRDDDLSGTMSEAELQEAFASETSKRLPGMSTTVLRSPPAHSHSTKFVHEESTVGILTMFGTGPRLYQSKLARAIFGSLLAISESKPGPSYASQVLLPLIEVVITRIQLFILNGFTPDIILHVSLR